MLRKFIYILIVFGFVISIAQESNQTIGIYGGYNYNIHLANFQKIPDVPNCCPKFEFGYGSGSNFGFLFEQKISDFILSGRIEQNNLDADLKTLEPTQVIINNSITGGEFEHVIKTIFTHNQFSLSLGYYLFDGFRINGGFFAGFYKKSDYSQYEKIAKPQGSGSFLDQFGNDSYSRIRNSFSGSIPNVSDVSFGSIVGVSYDLKLNRKKSFKLSPELNYQYFINDLAEDLDWKISSLKFAIALKYTPYSYPQKYKTVEKFDTINIISRNIIDKKFTYGSTILSQEKEILDDTEIITQNVQRTDTLLIPKPIILTANIKIIGLDSNNVEIFNPRYYFEQFVSNRHQPLLNYIFFDSLSSKLPERYSILSYYDAKQFRVNELSNKSTLDTYYEALNIIGQRLAAQPKSKIRLVGCNSNTGLETGNLNLSLRRANAVKKYLVDIWDINPNNIAVESKNLPQMYSYPSSDFEKAQENRRVEIYSNNQDILAPIFISDTIIKANPSKIRFYINTTADLPIKNWSLSLFNEDLANNVKIEKFGYEAPPTSVDMQISENDKIISKTNNLLSYNLNIVDTRNNRFNSENKPLYVETVTIDMKRKDKLGDIEVNKFNLILFDFVSADIGVSNLKIIELVKSKINPNSNVKIIGYTDKTGDSDKNKALSLQRATSANQLLSLPNTTVEGLGEDVILNNNDLPEGRFYSRTVEIIVETPIENN